MNILSYTQQMQDVLRKDPGVDGDAQRITQISWLLLNSGGHFVLALF